MAQPRSAASVLLTEEDPERRKRTGKTPNALRSRSPSQFTPMHVRQGAQRGIGGAFLVPGWDGRDAKLGRTDAPKFLPSRRALTRSRWDSLRAARGHRDGLCDFPSMAGSGVQEGLDLGLALNLVNRMLGLSCWSMRSVSLSVTIVQTANHSLRRTEPKHRERDRMASAALPPARVCVASHPISKIDESIETRKHRGEGQISAAVGPDFRIVNDARPITGWKKMNRPTRRSEPGCKHRD